MREGTTTTYIKVILAVRGVQRKYRFLFAFISVIQEKTY